MRLRFIHTFKWWLALLAGSSGVVSAAIAPADAEFFEAKVRPLFVDHCYECHSGAKTKGGLSLETKAGWSTGGDSGPAIVPGKPDESLLLKAVRYTDEDLAMPPKNKGGKLSDAQLAILEEWVRRGAPDPREATAKIGGMSEAEAKTWWAFQPLPKPVATAGQPKEIDAFINARLASAKVDAAPIADKRALIRRATFDLIGLPPTPQEVETFVADNSPDAFAKVIERLLASPHYGEKWGRHWLDVVRYADSLDSRIYDKDGDILDAWRYRDWVVNAFNSDLPYDQFIVQQLAGDILAAKEWDAQKVIATGIYAIGNWGNGDADKEKVHTDIVDDQIDVTGRAFLGLTLACARCHDHKFDPVTARDYYSMAGFFFSSRILEKFAPKGAGESLMRIPLLSPAEKARREELRKRIAEINKELSAELQPFTEVKKDAAGKSGLVAWQNQNTDNPSLVINTTEQQIDFATIKLPAQTIAMHPGPQVAASAVWRSPFTSIVKVNVRLKDIDPNCGDGITWLLRHGEKILHQGDMNNGSNAEVEETSVSVQPGELLQLIIRPRGEYTCDTTQIEFSVRDEQGARWDLREALVSGATQGQNGIWWLCAGEGTKLNQDVPEAEQLTAERKKLEGELAQTDFAQGILEGGVPETRYVGYRDVEIHKRGRYDQLGEMTTRSFPAIIAKEQPKISEGSGRLELARWIASPENPLTARVMVNRIWQHHFGDGLVRTANNFGKLGTPPTHPELLDWLATEFIRSGWSVKQVHRLIMNTAAYQRSSTPAASAGQSDPENQLVSHQKRRRLTAEELRDAMLSVAHRLDKKLGGKSAPNLMATRRTLYLTTIRSDRTGYQALFDGADPTAIVEKRTEATVAPQSLFLLNHPFTLAQAETLAGALEKAAPETEARTRWLWRQIFQHEPTTEDVALAKQALGENAGTAEWTAFCQMLLCSNEFAYVD